MTISPEHMRIIASEERGNNSRCSEALDDAATQIETLQAIIDEYVTMYGLRIEPWPEDARAALEGAA